jgi:hypothetical protein
VKRSTGLAILFLISLAGGCAAGRLFGYLRSNDLSVASIVGGMLMNRQEVRMVCTQAGCVPYIPASAVGQFDLGAQKPAIWASAIAASTVSVALFAAGFIWLERRNRALSARLVEASLRTLAQQAQAQQTQAQQAPGPVPTALPSDPLPASAE